jgi:2-polyprenyl-3-methyl-5-hydroxy-6-metoxy-1,4-benzoquinol methylase
LHKGSRGLGFAVGTEQLTALFASLGCQIVATDLEQALAKEAGWVDSNQHAAGLDALNGSGLCPPADFAEHVHFRHVDMRSIPADLRGFDFLWSSCAMEHLGSLQHGLDFVLAAVECLRPGGVAVHTTELNCESDSETIETGGSVIYRKSDLNGLAHALRARGHAVEPLDFHLGETAADAYVDEPPYGGKAHIKLRLGGFASTSFGLIITKGIAGSGAVL